MKTRVELLYEDCQKAIAYDSLSCASELRKIEAVANHYAKLAHNAMVLRKLVELSRCSAAIDENVMGMMRHLYNEIRLFHETDFGIKLDWKPRISTF